MTPQERKVMELALEALMYASYEDIEYDEACAAKVLAARDAIKEALAQPDATMQSLKDLKRSVCDEAGKATLAQPEQEPKSWIDLTDDEFEAVWLKHHDEYGYLRDENQDGWAYEKELLAKHKEKNT